MNKFLFKSTDADLQKLFQLLSTLQKNVLYTTHQVDFIVKEIRNAKIDKSLKKQVDEYFDDESHPNTPPSDDIPPEEVDHL